MRSSGPHDADPLHLTLVRRLARLAQVPLADNNARKLTHPRGTSARKRPPAARVITLSVINKAQKVIASRHRVSSPAVQAAARLRRPVFNSMDVPLLLFRRLCCSGDIDVPSMLFLGRSRGRIQAG